MEISEKLIEFAKNHAYPTANVKDVNMVPFAVDDDFETPFDLNGDVLYAEDILEAAIAKRLCALMEYHGELGDELTVSYVNCVNITENGVVAVFDTASGAISTASVTFPYRSDEPADENDIIPG